MNKDLLDILSSEAKEVDQQKMLDYLNGNLSEEERFEMEKLLLDADFESDAADGLQQVKDKTRLPVMVNELNRQLIKKLNNRRKGKRRKPFNLLLPVVASIIIILLVFMLFMYIRHKG